MRNVFNLIFMLLLAVCTGIISCQRDDSHHTKNPGTGSSRIITLEEFKAMPKAYERFEAVKNKQERKTDKDSVWKFEVYTDSILLYEKDGLKSLTFMAKPEKQRSYLENLVLNQETDGSYSVYYTVYNFTEEEKERIARNEKVNYSMKFFICDLPEYDALGLLKRRKLGGVYRVGNNCYQDYMVTTGSWSDIPGQTEFSSTEVITEQVDCKELPTDPSYTNPDGPRPSGGGPGIPVFNTPVPGSLDGYPGTPAGAGPGRKNPIRTKPVKYIDNPFAKKDCEKIKAVMKAGGYRAKVAAMASKVNDPINEHGLAQYLDGNSLELTPGPEIELSNSFYINAIHHTHNDAGYGTFSVFSYSDIEVFMQLLAAGKIDPDTFVATLSTKKGTHYALTISNVARFEEFFYHRFHDATPSNKDKWQDAEKKERNLKRKYFDIGAGIIKKNNNNNEVMLGSFLNFIKEANLGVNLFEADAAFENFKEVTKKNDNTYITDTQVVRNDICNKK